MCLSAKCSSARDVCPFCAEKHAAYLMFELEAVFQLVSCAQFFNYYCPNCDTFVLQHHLTNVMRKECVLF